MRKDIDLRTEVGGDPLWVVFFGRRPSVTDLSLAGHAFVGLGREDSTNQMSWLEAFGLYPKQTSQGAYSIVIGNVPGQIKDDAWVHSDVLLACRVSKAQFDRASALRQAWAEREYQLIFQDCVSFAFEVAHTLGLNVPARPTGPDDILLPVTLVEQLAAKNNTEDFPFGDWNSNDSAGRWNLLLDLLDGTWTERSATTASLLSQPTRITRMGSRAFRVERENNAAVLSFLGARDSVRQALLARGVRPSYMILTRTRPTQFEAQWFGLRWTLDPQNNLRTVTQPGDAPGSPLTLTRRV